MASEIVDLTDDNEFYTAECDWCKQKKRFVVRIEKGNICPTCNQLLNPPKKQKKAKTKKRVKVQNESIISKICNRFSGDYVLVKSYTVKSHYRKRPQKKKNKHGK